MMLRIWIALIFSAIAATGQYVGNVTGTVNDAVTRQPLADAVVVLARTNTGVMRNVRTDSQGRFLINRVPVQYPFTTYSIVAKATGHRAAALPSVHVLPGAVMAVECAFALPPESTAIRPHGALLASSFNYSHERALPRAGAAVSGKIFATREGLVGRTTANGHVIRSGDRFVALPSRRALNPQGERKFLVRVAYQGRSATVPVWDIGPWNIKDDYWNDSPDRESWRTLPRGVPQAQAAFLQGHNNGRDGFGRPVLNPAGIDLSDAVFQTDLRMPDNDWISVEYLWDPTLVSTREPLPDRRRPSPSPTRTTPRTLRDVIAIAEAILIQVTR